MLQRVMPELMGMKNVVVLNDEAHHCYREKAGARTRMTEGRGQGGGQEEQRGGAALDLRHRGGQAQARLARCLRPLGDAFLPARLRLRRGHAVPWVVSDFSLMDAIECGIVKLPRVPVADNLPTGDMPSTATSGTTSARRCRRRAAARAGELDPLELCRPSSRPRSTRSTATTRRPSRIGRRAGIGVPPVFIVVCNNTATSKLVYEYISGFEREHDDGDESRFDHGRLELFRNLRRVRQPPAAPAHAADRQRAARIRRGARPRLPRRSPRPEIEQFKREKVAARRRRRRRRRSPTRTCCAR